jgi:predicted lipoprotein with Yx(FWY)xxD motif
MRTPFVSALVVSAALLSACSGGGSTTTTGGARTTSAGYGYVMPPAAPPPPAPPTIPPTQPNLPLLQMVARAPAWVDPATHKTMYFLDVDTPLGRTCTAACLTLWPVFIPTPVSQPTGRMSIIIRFDHTSRQWAYQGHPLYTFAGDPGPDLANGDNFPEFGGHWHVARPVPATPTPGGTPPPPCVGSIFC